MVGRLGDFVNIFMKHKLRWNKNCDKTGYRKKKKHFLENLKLKLWQNFKTQLKNSIYDKTQRHKVWQNKKLKFWQNSKNKIMKKIKGSNCETTQTPQLGEEKKVFWEEHFDTSTTL